MWVFFFIVFDIFMFTITAQCHNSSKREQYVVCPVRLHTTSLAMNMQTKMSPSRYIYT